MRRIALAIGFFLTALQGCHWPGHKTEMGWEFRVIKPPVLNTETPVLIQTQAGGIEPIPMGGTSGPINLGQWQQQRGNATPMPIPLMMPNRADTIGPCLPPISQQRMTCEEWCRTYGINGTLPPPRGN